LPYGAHAGRDGIGISGGVRHIGEKVIERREHTNDSVMLMLTYEPLCLLKRLASGTAPLPQRSPFPTTGWPVTSWRALSR